MRRLVLLAVVVGVAGRAEAADVHTAMLLGQADVCDGLVHEDHWGNLPVAAYIRGFRMWQGADLDAKVDIGGSVWISRDGNSTELVYPDSMDRYANPTGPVTLPPLMLPAGDYFLLPAGGWVTFRRTCAAVSATGGAAAQVVHAQQSLLIYYSETP